LLYKNSNIGQKQAIHFLTKIPKISLIIIKEVKNMPVKKKATKKVAKKKVVKKAVKKTAKKKVAKKAKKK